MCTTLVDRYRGAAYAVARSHLGNADDAQDAAQEAFIEAFLGLNGLRAEGSFGAWLATIVRRQCSKLIQRNQRRARILSQQMMAQEASTLTESGRIQGLVDALSEIDREILSLSALAGYTYEEIGRMLDLSVGAIKSRMHRARTRLSKEVITMHGDQKLPDISFSRETIERLILRLASAPQPANLSQIARETDDKELAAVVSGLASLMEQGQSLGGAMLTTRLIPGAMAAIFSLGGQLGREAEAFRVVGGLLREDFIQPESPVGRQEVADFCAHLACLCQTGIPLPQAIDMAGQRVRRLEAFAAGLREHARSGGWMADFFAKTDSVFTESFAGVVRLAEGTEKFELAVSILATALWHPEFLDTTRMAGDWVERMKNAEELLRAWRSK